MILHESSNGLSRSYPHRLRFLSKHCSSDFKDAGKKLYARLRRGGQSILDSKRPRSAISFRSLHSSTVKGLCAGIKPRRSGRFLHATPHKLARYSDILISGVFLLTTSSPPPGIHILSSWNLLSALNLRSRHIENSLEITLPGIRQFPRWLCFIVGL